MHASGGDPGVLGPEKAQAQIFGPGARTEFISGLGVRTGARFLRANDLLSRGEPIPDPLGT